jgi:hypothetical protein
LRGFLSSFFCRKVCVFFFWLLSQVSSCLWFSAVWKLYMRLDVDIFIYLFWGTGAWTQGLHLEPLHQPYFCEGFFEIGSCKLFACVGFEPRSCWPLPPE